MRKDSFVLLQEGWVGGGGGRKMILGRGAAITMGGGAII